MHATRRQFLRTGLVAGSALTIGLRAAPARRSLRILILGGTGFSGPHLVARALERGHEVTLFNRGRSNPTTHRDEVARVEELTGDRGSDLSALEGRTWDAVIDNSGFRAAWTRDSATLLRDAVDLYLYTSSTGVYYPYLGADLSEDTRLVLEAPDDANEDLAYGVMKAQSELEARRAFGEDRAIVVRPTYIAGPGDTSNRFPYWPVRIERGGRVLVPGRPEDPVQYVDVRDLAEFMIHLLETRAAGTYNVAGPASRLGMHAFVHGVHAAVSSPVEWVPIPDYDFLVEHGVPYVVPWIMPVDDNFGSARVNASRAAAAGLAFRPLAATVRDTLDWWHSDAVPDARKVRLTDDPEGLMAREAAILDAWRARSANG